MVKLFLLPEPLSPKRIITFWIVDKVSWNIEMGGGGVGVVIIYYLQVGLPNKF